MESLLKFVNTPFRLFCTMLVLYMAALLTREQN